MFEAVYKALSAVGYTHPFHPAMTSLPLGMVTGALVFALIGLVFRHHDMTVTARHCILLALLSVFPTILLGYMDWQHYYGGAWLFPIKIKMILAVSLIVLLGLSAWLQARVETKSKAVLLLYALCFVNVIGLGYFGGEVVFGAARSQAQEEPSSQSTKVAYADVEKIFHRECVGCHSGSTPPAGVRLDSYEHVIAGGQAGPVIIPRKPNESELVERIKGTEQPRMPFGKPPLSESEIQLIVRWVQQGAPGSIANSVHK